MDSATRLATLTVVTAAIVNYYADVIRHHNVYYIMGFLGFMSYKISVVREMSNNLGTKEKALLTNQTFQTWREKSRSNIKKH